MTITAASFQPSPPPPLRQPHPLHHHPHHHDHDHHDHNHHDLHHQYHQHYHNPHPQPTMDSGSLLHPASLGPFYPTAIGSASGQILPPSPVGVGVGVGVGGGGIGGIGGVGGVGSVQDSVAARSALAVSGQNGWGAAYGNEPPLVPQHSCSMPPSAYANPLQLGSSFSVNGKAAAAAAAYGSFGPGGDYFQNCRQISQLGSTLNSMRSYHPSLYGDVYQTAAAAGHPPTYSNGPFYPDMTPAGLHHLAGRDLSCSGNPSDSSSQGEAGEGEG